MVKRVVSPSRHQGLAADTAAWLAANTNLQNGSTYMEVDGTWNLYKIHEGVWYPQQ